MKESAFAFPKMLGRILERLPALPPSFAFTSVLNLALGRIIDRTALEPLQGKRIAIRVADLGLHLHFTVTPKGFSPIRSDAPADLAFSASAQDFYLLALRKEDPDTLFFSRRLLVEGDTELGLVAKNTLDSMELPAWMVSLLTPPAPLLRLGSRLLNH